MNEQTYTVKDTMNLYINGSVRTIELCLGDISELECRENVDVLLMSAKPDAYAEANGTVIHALKKNLDVSVADLARNKARDRRATHKCWWSQPQPQGIPFRTLMCYESGNREPLAAEIVNNVFPCVRDIVQARECRIATVLLNTGQQKANEVYMLEAIVQAAISAMENGLNLIQLMIFVYDKYRPWYLFWAVPLRRNPTAIYTMFSQLKAIHEARFQNSSVQ